MGDYFLRRFLSEAALAAKERGIGEVTPLSVDGWKLDDIEVATERHRIDIMLIAEADEFVCLIENKIGTGEHSTNWAASYVCLIENKIGTGEHSNQLGRYLSTVEREYEGLNPFQIFLTLRWH